MPMRECALCGTSFAKHRTCVTCKRTGCADCFPEGKRQCARCYEAGLVPEDKGTGMKEPFKAAGPLDGLRVGDRLELAKDHKREKS